jgi:serine protease Do
MEGFAKHGDFKPLSGEWVLDGNVEREGRTGDMNVRIFEEKVVGNEKETRPIVIGKLAVEYRLEPLKTLQDEKDLTAHEKELMVPPYSGGMLMAMYHYRRFLTQGEKGFESKNFVHGGVEPIYVQPLSGPESKSYKDIRVNCEVIRTEHASVEGKWYFYRSELNPHSKDKLKYKENELVAFEIFVAKDQDPCEVYLHESKEIDGRLLPGKMEIRNGDKRYAILSLKDYRLAR